jgi:hypothetical protein
MSSLDIGQVANSFCLFRLPRVKEILGKRIDGFKQSPVDINSVQYKDANKGKQHDMIKIARVEKFERKMEENKFKA